MQIICGKDGDIMSVFVCEKCGHPRDEKIGDSGKDVKGRCINGCREFREV